MAALPENFVRTIRGTFGVRGEAWLERLPLLLAECEQRWALTLLPAFPNLSYNYVAPAVRTNGAGMTNVVVKVGVPNRELNSEIAALRWYGGRGAVRVLDADEAQGILLLERLQPGTTLTTLADEAHDAQATTIAASVMRALWQPLTLEQNRTLPHPFPTVEDWMQGLPQMQAHFQGANPFSSRLLEESCTLSRELLASMDTRVLLHGDLHHDNILLSAPSTFAAAASSSPLPASASSTAASSTVPSSASTNAPSISLAATSKAFADSVAAVWCAIDPKGVIGEPAYEVGALLRNLWPERHTFPNPAAVIARRIAQLSEELNLDRARVRGWGVAQAVLSTWWSLEDREEENFDWEASLNVATWIAQVKV